MSKKILLFTLILFFNLCSLHALEISGKVIEADTGETIPGCIITISETGTSCVTDHEGNFLIKVPQNGKYTLTAEMMSFRPQSIEVDVLNSVSPSVTFTLYNNREDLDEIVVSASRNAVRRRDAPVVVNVMSPKLFEKVNATDLAQTLNYQSGLRVENNCQNCGFPQVRINGLEGPYSQILVNSRPVVSSLSGVYALEQIPVNMIERIEVVRGGGSALFGANAVGGTINIITKDPVTNHFEGGTSVSCIGGSAWEEVFTANANFTGSDGKYGIALYETYRHRSPYDRDGDDFSEVGKLRMNTLGLNSFFRLSPTARLGIEYHNTNEFRRGGNKFDLEPFQTDITEQTQHDINSGGITYTQGWREYTRRLSAYSSVQYIDRSSYYGAQQNPDAYGKTSDLTWVTGATFAADFNKVVVSPATFTSGVEYQTNRLHDVMTGYGRDMKQDVNIFGAFVQNEWRGRYFSLLAGARLDFHNLIDNPIFSPRVNLLYKPNNDLQARLTWSTGFRAPQAYDEDLHVTAVGGEGVIIRLADGLKPERSNSLSASIDKCIDLGDWDLDILADVFYTELRHVFVLQSLGFDPESDSSIKERRNGNGAKVYGIDFDISASLRQIFNARIGFTVQKSRYNSPEAWSEDPEIPTTRDMPRSPDTYGYVTIGGKLFRNLTWDISGIYTGRMYVPHFAPDMEEIPDGYPYTYLPCDELKHTRAFFELGVKLAYDFHISPKLNLQVNAGVRNITDTFQPDLDRGGFRDSGYFYGPAMPRTVYVGIKLSSL